MKSNQTPPIDALYAQASHDLKAPLTVMKVYVQSCIKSLKQKEQTQEIQQLELVDRKIDAMVELIRTTFEELKKST